MNRVGLLLLFGSFLFGESVFSGCSSEKINKQIDDKLGTLEAVDVSSETEQLLRNKTDLSEGQREKLNEIRLNTHNQLASVDLMSRKLRVILIQDIMSPNYDDREATLVKTRLRDLEEERIKIIFSATDHANKVMGREEKKPEDNILQNKP